MEEATGQTEEGRQPAAIAATSSAAKLKKVQRRPPKLDHLGLPVAMNRQKFKYARTYTIMYDAEKERDLREEKQWQLLRDAKKGSGMDLSLAGIADLFKLFLDSARGAEPSMIGPKTFCLVLRKHGIRDPVLLIRLYKEFASQPNNDKINYRDFMKELVSVNEEPLEDRISLLFDVWDVDASGSLSYSELGQIMVTGVASNEIDEMTEHFNHVWSEIRSNVQEANDDWMGVGRSSGVGREDLVESARKAGPVREFFTKLLNRQPPAPSDRTPLNFAARLRELQAEVLKESRAEEKKELKDAASKQGTSQRTSGTPLRASQSLGSLNTGSTRAGAPRRLPKSSRTSRDSIGSGSTPKLPAIF